MAVVNNNNFSARCVSGGALRRKFKTVMYMHEYGHTIDSRIFSWSYLFAIGISSGVSAAGSGDHSTYWTETRANRRAAKYFGKHYGIDWNSFINKYPLH